MQHATPPSASEVSHTAVAHGAQPTVSTLTLGHAALPAAQDALEAAAGLWSCSGKIEDSPALGVDRLRKPEGFIRMSTDAVEAKPEGLTHQIGENAADPAASVTRTSPGLSLKEQPTSLFHDPALPILARRASLYWAKKASL